MSDELKAALEVFAADIASRVKGRVVPGNPAALADAFRDAAGPLADRMTTGSRVRHRAPSGKNQPTTMHAGDIVGSLLKLSDAHWDDRLRLFLFLTDDEMAGYLDNPENGLKRLFDLREGEPYLLTERFMASRPPSFRSQLRHVPADVNVVGMLRRDLGEGYHLRVWQVLPAADVAADGASSGTASEAARPTPTSSPTPTMAKVVIHVPDDWHEVLATAQCIPIEPERDADGSVHQYQPQGSYEKRDSVALNAYGKGSFCRFRVPANLTQSGVYLIVTNDRLAYVGECQDFSQRFNTGYGQISPKNCYRGGQETNCRINALILNCATSGWPIDVHFIPTPEPSDRFALEAAYIRAYRPPWNRSG